ncbi:MAG: efflux RND transporter periplasmic adaptor subunit [Sodaliphilus sp.]
MSCKRPTPKEDSNNTYSTMVLKEGSRTLKTEYTAKLQGCQVVEVRPQVEGTITRICFDEGDKIRKGQTLFVIDQVPFRAALAEAVANVASAKAKLSSAKLNLESARKLREKDVVKDYDVSAAFNEVNAAEAVLQMALAQEKIARNNLSYTEVKSPVDGVAGMIGFRVGALVSSGIDQPLVTVSDNGNIYAYFALTESQVVDLVSQYQSIENFIKQAPAVELKMSNGSTYPHKGRISAMSGIVSDGTGAVTLRADFSNSEGLLRDGGSGAVILPTSKSNCIVIPQSATFELQNKVFVYKVVNGKAVSTPVTLFKLTGGTEYLVEKGLCNGDTIIAEGAGLVKEGAIVKSKAK